MGRGRAKGKKLSSTNQDDLGSGEDERMPQQKRRGRPVKPLKDEMDEEEAPRMEDDDSEDTLDKDMKGKSATVGRKRTRNAQMKDELVSSVKEENESGVKASSTEESNKSSGFRPNGNRRKNKPHRAPEAIVECN